MTSAVLRRLARLVIVFFAVTFMTAVMLDLGGGNPAYRIAGEGASPEQIARVTAQYHLSDPVVVRYFRWLGDVFHGRLGTSLQTGLPVSDILRTRVPVTVELAVVALVIGYGLAVPVGIYCAYRRGSWFDRALTTISAGFTAAPVFVIGLLLVFIFSVSLHMLPALGWVPLTTDPVQNLRSVLLPAASLAIPEFVVAQRVLRADAIEVMKEDYVEFAHAKGLRPRSVLLHHVLRPSVFPILTLSAISIGRLLGGVVIVETVFSLPGLGALMPEAVTGKDFLVIQSMVTFVAVVYIAANLVVDLLYEVVDPRVRVRA